jgi:hypothetical protein
MRTMYVGLGLTVTLLVSLSCGGRTPTPPTPIVTSVTISSSTDMLKVKEAATFAATASRSDGTTAPVTDWRSDAPTVATVDAATGKVTGVSPGMATIVATHDRMSATKLVRVVPDFAGTWVGSFEITVCSASGVFMAEGGCNQGSPYGVGRTGAVRFEDLGQDRDSIVGYIEYPVYNGWDGTALTTGTVRGTITTSGHLPLTGAFTGGNSFGPRLTFTLSADGTDLYIESDRMVGSFTLELSHQAYDGRMAVRHTISLAKMGTSRAQS